MGFLMLAIMTGGLAYGSYGIKKDIECHKTKVYTEATLNPKINKRNLNQYFDRICDRCGIAMEDGKPISDKNINTAIQYIQSQGYTESEVEYFKDIFYEKYESRRNAKIEKITKEVKDLDKRLKIRLRDKKVPREMIVFKPTIYKSSLSPQARIDKLLENEVWNQIVDHQTYIPSVGSGQWTEVWSLAVPKNFFRKGTTIKQIYRNVCTLQQIEYTIR